MIFVGFGSCVFCVLLFYTAHLFRYGENGQSHRTAQKNEQRKTKNHNTQKPKETFSPAGFVGWWMMFSWNFYDTFGFPVLLFFEREFFLHLLWLCGKFNNFVMWKGIFFLDWNGFVALVTDIPLNISVKGNFPSLKEKLLNDSISFKHNANIYFSLQVCKACRFSQQYYNTFETKTFSRSFPLFIDFFCPHTILSNNRAIKSLRKQK